MQTMYQFIIRISGSKEGTETLIDLLHEMTDQNEYGGEEEKTEFYEIQGVFKDGYDLDNHELFPDFEQIIKDNELNVEVNTLNIDANLRDYYLYHNGNLTDSLVEDLFAPKFKYLYGDDEQRYVW